MSKLDQGQINPIKKNIAKILKNYSISNFNFSVNPRGAHNTTIIITEKGGNKYAMRVYCQNRRTKNEIRLEIDYINFLFNRGLPVPEVVPHKKNNYIAETEIDGKLWYSILTKFFRGNHPKFYSKKLLKDLAFIQAKMHLLAPAFNSKYSNLLKLCDTGEKSKNYLYTDLLSVDKINLKNLKKIELKNFLARALKLSINFKKLPIAIVHKDIHAFNIIENKGKLAAVLDFDDLFNGPLFIGLPYMLWDIYVKNNDWSYASYYINEYEKTRKILKEERENIKNFLLLRNYIMGTVEYLVGGENSKGVLMMNLEKYFKIEKEIMKLKIEKLYGKK
ncbi:MAG: phosphotransferase [Patescibacteria group bacterium]